MKQNQYFLEFLHSHKKIDKKTYESLMERTDDFDCLDFLITQDKIKPADKLEALASYFDVPCIDLDHLTISQNFEKYFSLELMKKYLFVPIYISQNGTMIIATSDVNNPQMQTTVQMVFDGDVQYILVEKQKIVDFLNSYQATIATKDVLDTISKNIESSEKTYEEELSIQNAPAVKFVDSIIKEAVPLRASDIHIEPNDADVVIRYRIDGDLIEWAKFPVSSYPEISARIKILSNIDIAEKRIPQDGRITLNINGEDVNFRVSTLPTIHGEKFVIRILDSKLFSYNLKELDFAPDAYNLIGKILKHPHGIILLTGPTGSGKTTTLYAFLRELNNGKNNIVTIEDPVEFAMSGINQVQVNPKANVTFATSLRSILRQDPDVIMVGEIRDEETAQIATRAAITGHLVLSTLHTNDATGAVIRLIDMGIPQYLASDAIVAVISQRLIKRLCPHCKKRVKTTLQMMDALNLKESMYIYRANGCPFCNHTGYKGRLAVHEILYFDKKLKNKLDTQELNIETLSAFAEQSGMISLAEACKKYVLNGTTSLEEFINLTLGQ